MDWIEKLDGYSFDDLLQAEKKIISKEPKSGYKEEFNHLRTDLELEAVSIKARYRMFIRQNKTYPENFSIGLEYYGPQGTVKLIRFNGAHKRIEDKIDDHHYNYHIHIETGEEDSLNALQTIENTNEYSDLVSAIKYSMDRLCITNYSGYFPDIDQLVIDLEEA